MTVCAPLNILSVDMVEDLTCVAAMPMQTVQMMSCVILIPMNASQNLLRVVSAMLIVRLKYVMSPGLTIPVPGVILHLVSVNQVYRRPLHLFTICNKITEIPLKEKYYCLGCPDDSKCPANKPICGASGQPHRCGCNADTECKTGEKCSENECVTPDCTDNNDCYDSICDVNNTPDYLECQYCEDQKCKPGNFLFIFIIFTKYLDLF